MRAAVEVVLLFFEHPIARLTKDLNYSNSAMPLTVARSDGANPHRVLACQLALPAHLLI